MSIFKLKKKKAQIQMHKLKYLFSYIFLATKHAKTQTHTKSHIKTICFLLFLLQIQPIFTSSLPHLFLFLSSSPNPLPSPYPSLLHLCQLSLANAATPSDGSQNHHHSKQTKTACKVMIYNYVLRWF